MLIGIGEGLITVGALAFLHAARRDLFTTAGRSQKGGAVVWVFGLTIALALAVLSPLASTHPDGLMWVARQHGFLEAGHVPLSTKYSLLISFPEFQIKPCQPL